MTRSNKKPATKPERNQETNEAGALHAPSRSGNDTMPFFAPRPGPATLEEREFELRSAVLDRLIAARLRESKPVQEATLAQWRTISAPQNGPDGSSSEAG